MSYTRAFCLVCHFSATCQYRNSSEGCRQLQLFYKPVAVAATFWSSVLRRATADGIQCRGNSPPGLPRLHCGDHVSYLWQHPQEPLQRHWCFGSRRSALFAAGLRVLEPAAGPHSCTWDVRCSAHSASGVTSRPLTFGSQAALLLLALSCRSCCIDTGVSGAAGRPYLLQSFTRVVLSIAPQEPATGLLLSGAARRPCYCRHFKFGAVVLALVSREPQAGPVCCRPLRKKAVLPTVLQEQAIGHSFPGDARRPCCCSPLEAGTVAWCWSLGSCRSALFAAGLFVLGAVRRPIQLHLGRLLLAVLKEPSTGPLLSGAVRRPCCCALPPSFGCRLSALLTVLKALSTGPLLLGAVWRPCCCRPFCFGRRLPAHSTVLGDVCQQDSVCQCACWWWLSRPKRVCQWSLRRGHFLLEVLALEDMGVLFLRFL